VPWTVPVLCAADSATTGAVVLTQADSNSTAGTASAAGHHLMPVSRPSVVQHLPIDDGEGCEVAFLLRWLWIPHTTHSIMPYRPASAVAVLILQP
jgi:hypothetical protein